MSDRLMNMKFMQRSAAGATASPQSGTPHNETSKRFGAKTQNAANPLAGMPQTSTPSAGAAHATAEEPKLEVILDRQAEAAGDTHWFVGDTGVVDASPGSGFKVAPIGYDAIDSPRRDKGSSEVSREGEVTASPRLKRTANGGRKSFGRFNKMIERLQYPDRPVTPPESSEQGDTKDEDELSSLGEQSFDEATGNVARRRHGQSSSDGDPGSDNKVRKRFKQEGEDRLSRGKRPRDGDFDRIMSISSRSGNTASTLKCYACGGNHKKDVCPSRAMKKRR